MTPSHACAQEGELDCLRYLIKVAHAHEHAVDNNGCTLLHYGNISYYKWPTRGVSKNISLNKFNPSRPVHF